MTHIVSTKDGRNRLVHTDQGHILAQAHPISPSPREAGLLHSGRAGLVGVLALALLLEPSLRAERLDVAAEDVLVPRRGPCVHTDNRACWNGAAVGQLEPGARYHSFKNHPDWWEDPEALVDDGV